MQNNPETNTILISRIAKRFQKVMNKYAPDHKMEVIDTMMDIEAVNNYLPIDLPGLLMASDADFNHDCCGIMRHLNRESGTLQDCFVPRYVKTNQIDNDQEELF